MAVKTYKKGDTAKLSKNFSVREFACHGSGCCTTVQIDDKLVDYLQKIRDHFKAPVIINSAYRNHCYNKKVGGASNSQHLYGAAADIRVKGVSPKEVAAYAEQLMPDKGGIGIYPTFVHVDVRRIKSRWRGN